MAPATSTTRRRSEKTQKTTPPTRRIITRSIYKKEQLLLSQKFSNQTENVYDHFELESPSSSPMASREEEDDQQQQPSAINDNNIISNDEELCSTPKSEKHKIPEVRTCPPAPKKAKNNNCLIQKRRPITFFAHPDLEKFFMFASPMRNIKV